MMGDGGDTIVLVVKNRKRNNMGNPNYSKEQEVTIPTVIKDKNRVIFWATDCQKDFLLPGGKLYVKGAEKLLPNLSRLTSLAVSKNITVVSTGDYHTYLDKEISDKPDFITTFPPHCLVGEEGGEFVNETYPKLIHRHYYIVLPTDNCYEIGTLEDIFLARVKDIILFKNDFDVFKGNLFTDKILSIINPETVIIYGVAANICIKYALEGLLNRGYKVILVVDAIKGTNEEETNKLLEVWYNRGVQLLNTQEVEIYYGNS